MRPHLSCLICTAPRTGSWMLSAGLRSTGLAGRPEEYFGAEGLRFYTERWKYPSLESYADYLDRVLDVATTPNGIFGAKIHWYQVGHLTNALRSIRDPADATPPLDLLAAFFPNPRFVILLRRDKLRQAISWYRALGSGLWWMAQDADGGVRTSWGVPSASGRPTPDGPDFARIDELIRRLESYEQNWRQLLVETDPPPIELTYEQIVADYPSTVLSVLRFLGVSAPPGLRIPRPELVKLADQTTDEWVHRYVARQRSRK
jgi:trehalose 2-sulfotransferase